MITVFNPYIIIKFYKIKKKPTNYNEKLINCARV